jgi:hypothetical protein
MVVVLIVKHLVVRIKFEKQKSKNSKAKINKFRFIVVEKDIHVMNQVQDVFDI